MTHELQSNDNLVLVGEAAWHGLGLVVDKSMTPREAAKMVFPWKAEEKLMTIRFNDQQWVIETHKALIRSDDGSQLGIVSANYHTIQPYDMADFAEALLDVGHTQIETAGSIRGGKKLWFLLKGEEFQVAMGDLMYPYILLSNGYDGLTTFRITPTTVRAVCSNTLHAIIPNYDTGTLGNAAISIRHTVNAMERIEEAKLALKEYGKAIDETKKAINTLAAKSVTSDEVKEFFLACYTADFGEIPANPKNGFEERRVLKAQSAFNSFSKRFDDERQIAGCSAWNMFNSYSGLVQHDKKAKGIDDVARVERRVEQNLFGLNQDRTQAAAARAFKACVAV